MGIVTASTKSWGTSAGFALAITVFLGTFLSLSSGVSAQAADGNVTQSKISPLLPVSGITYGEFQIARSLVVPEPGDADGHHHEKADDGRHHQDGGSHQQAHSNAVDVDRVERVEELEDWTAEGVNAASGPLKDLLAAGTIIHFWASWCGPCEEEFPDLQAFYSEHIEGSDSLRLVTITNDRGLPPARRFITKHKTTFPVYLDPEQRTNLSILGRRELPSTVIVDADGRFHRLALGKLEWSYPKLPQVLTTVAGIRSSAGSNQE